MYRNSKQIQVYFLWNGLLELFDWIIYATNKYINLTTKLLSIYYAPGTFESAKDRLEKEAWYGHQELALYEANNMSIMIIVPYLK